MTSAPSRSSRVRNSLACSRARVTTMRRPKSGRRSNHAKSRAATSPTTIADGASTPAVRDRRQRGADRALLRARSPSHGGDGRLRRPTARDEFVDDLRQVARAHEDHERPARARERRPVGVGRALRRVFVAGHDRHARRHAAMRHRDARVRGGGDRARDAGHDLERDAGRDARLGFLAAAAEHERVAALQPHDRLAREPTRDQHLVDLFLRHRGPARGLAHVDELSRSRREREQGGRRESVVDDDVSGPQQLLAATCQQARIAGPARRRRYTVTRLRHRSLMTTTPRDRAARARPCPRAGHEPR